VQRLAYSRDAVGGMNEKAFCSWPLFRPQSQRTMTKEQSRNKFRLSQPEAKVLELSICRDHNHKRDAVLI
jgi:hypothetical protein